MFSSYAIFSLLSPIHYFSKQFPCESFYIIHFIRFKYFTCTLLFSLRVYFHKDPHKYLFSNIYFMSSYHQHNLFYECFPQSIFYLSAYISNDGLSHVLSLYPSFRYIFNNFPPMFSFDPYRLIVDYWYILPIRIFTYSYYLLPFLLNFLLPSLRKSKKGFLLL